MLVLVSVNSLAVPSKQMTRFLPLSIAFILLALFVWTGPGMPLTGEEEVLIVSFETSRYGWGLSGGGEGEDEASSGCVFRGFIYSRVSEP